MNLERLLMKNGHPTTLFLFSLKYTVTKYILFFCIKIYNRRNIRALMKGWSYEI